jgi:hypothetical protein
VCETNRVGSNPTLHEEMSTVSENSTASTELTQQPENSHMTWWKVLLYLLLVASVFGLVTLVILAMTAVVKPLRQKTPSHTVSVSASPSPVSMIGFKSDEDFADFLKNRVVVDISDTEFPSQLAVAFDNPKGPSSYSIMVCRASGRINAATDLNNWRPFMDAISQQPDPGYPGLRSDVLREQGNVVDVSMVTLELRLPASMTLRNAQSHAGRTVQLLQKFTVCKAP